MCVNKTNFHMKDFALGLTLKQRRKATQKSPINRALSQSTYIKNKDGERSVVFIGISLLLIVNWQLNVYAHKFK